MKIKKTKNRGRGIFADKDYKIGDILEVCSVIKISEKDRAMIDSTKLYDYYFSWGKNDNEAAIALGLGSLYNHSYSPNAKYVKKITSGSIEIIAIKNIKNNDEILVNYNGDPSIQTPLWFDVVS